MNFSKHYISLKDYFLTKETFELWQDLETDLLKTVPQPKELERYYESEDYLSHDDTKKSFFALCYNIVKHHNLKSKKKLITKFLNQGSVLDIGAGIGDLVATLKSKSLKVQGYEPSSKAREVALEKGITLLSAYPQSNNQFDLITMYHVLEHVPDLQNQIQQITGLLKSNGFLIIALPNYRSLDARFFKQYWAGYDVPRHLYHFNKNAVNAIFKNEFQLVKTQPMWFDSFYVSILSAAYKKLPLSFLMGVFIGLCSNCSAIFTKEPSSITYILKKRD